MPRAIYARAAQRGFPVVDVGGQTGQGALPDSMAPPPVAGLPAGSWTDPNQDPGSVPATMPGPEAYVLGGLGQPLWGLPASLNPDDTPYTHQAPFADPALLAEGISEGTKGPGFTGWQLRNPATGQAATGTQAVLDQGRTYGQGSAADTLQPLTGQIRSQAGRDAVQGYGGGGPGPGGVNSVQGPATDQMSFGGYTYHNLPVSAAEKPFLSADAVQFIATAPELPPYAPTYDAPTSAVLVQQMVTTDIPAQGPPLAAQPVIVYPGLPWG